MLTDYKKIDLFGLPFLQKIDFTTPFQYAFPNAEQACFLFMFKGEMTLNALETVLKVPTEYSLLLNCSNAEKQILESESNGELVIVSFHPEVLKRVYNKEIPQVLQPSEQTSLQMSERVGNDLLIKKYIEGLLFYFYNPRLVNDELLIIKLKEIVLLLSQTDNAEVVRVILSQLITPANFNFKQIVEANIYKHLNVEELARRTNLSVSSFKREFKRLYDDSPANYIKSKRLEYAAKLLTGSDARITDITYACGFNDLASFTKSFKEKFDMPPTEYRRKSVAF